MAYTLTIGAKAPAFQLPANNAASGLKLVLDGQALINPYLSVFL